MNKKRVLSFILADTLLAASVLPVYAKEQNLPKQEVIYANLDTDGAPKQVYAVNIWTPETGVIEDQGNYTSVNNMNTEDPIQYRDGKITIQTEAEKLYYEGRMEADTPLPWNISVSYKLNGRKIEASDLAGQDGHMDIEIHLAENPKCNPVFFENYAMQVTLMLKGKNSWDVTAPDAVIANVGGDKQVTFTVLPNRDSRLHISCEVRDFEMDAIQLNGLPLSLNVEVDDKELLDKVAKLQDGVLELDDGTEKLSSGAKELLDGEGALKDGISELEEGVGGALTEGADALNNGAETLDGGMNALNAGLVQAFAGLEQLDANSAGLNEGSKEFLEALLQVKTALSGVSASNEQMKELLLASSQVKQGITALSQGADTLAQKLSFETYYQLMLSKGLNLDELKAGNEKAIAGNQKMMETANQLAAAAEKMNIPKEKYEAILQEGLSLGEVNIRLLKGSTVNIEGIEAYLTAMHTNAEKLSKGAADLKEQYQLFDEAVGTLAGKLTSLMGNMNQLAAAVNALADAYTELDSGLSTYTDGVAAVLAGYESINQGAVKLVKGTDELAEGTKSLKSGVKTVLDGTQALQDGSGKLSNGAEELYNGTKELRDGTSTMREKTEHLDTEVTDRIDQMLADVTGNLETIPSFVSNEDIHVDAVQFVLKTDAVQKEEPPKATEETEEPKNFWEKLTDLF